MFSTFPSIRLFKALHDLALGSILNFICFYVIPSYWAPEILVSQTALRLSSCCSLCQEYCCCPRQFYFVTNSLTPCGFPIKCHLKKDLLAILPKRAMQPPHHTVPFQPILFLVTEFITTQNHIKYSVVVFLSPPLKCEFPEYRVASSYYLLHNDCNIYSMSAMCYMLCSMLETQQWIKQTRSLSSWSLHFNERDKLGNK